MLAGARVWQEVELCEHKDLLEAGGLQTFLSCPVTFLVMESIMIIAEDIRWLWHVIQRLCCLSESHAIDFYHGLDLGSDYYLISI